MNIPARQLGPVSPIIVGKRAFSVGIGIQMLNGGVLIMAAGLAVSLALMHAGLAIAAVGLVVARIPISRSPGFWWVAAYACWQLISMLTSSATGGEPLLKRGYGSAYTWLAMYAAIEAFREERIRMWGVLLASLTTVASFALAMVQFTVGFGGNVPFRVSSAVNNRWTSAGFFPLHLTQGFMMTQIALLAWTQPLATGRWRLVHWAGRVAPFGCVLLTGGRTGLVAAISAGTAWFGSSGLRRLAVAGAICVFSILLAGGWLMWTRPQAVEGILTMRDGRIIHWQVACRLVAEHPVLGVGGAKDFKRENNRVVAELYPDGSQNRWLDAPDAHNSFLGIASEHGVPALLFYLGFLAAVLLHLWRARQTHPWAWRLGCGLVASALIAGQFEHLAGHSTTCYGLFVPLGFAVALTLAQRPETAGGGSPDVPTLDAGTSAS